MIKFKNKTTEKNTIKYLNLRLLQIIFLLSLGPVIAQENGSSLPKFQAIHVSGVAKVFFTQEESKEIEMIVSGDPYPQVIRRVNNGVLEISTKGEAQNEVVEIFVSNPTLNSIIVSDRAEFHSIEKIVGESLRIEVKDVGSAEIDISVKKVAIHMDGGDLKISGQANERHISKTRESDRGTLENNLLANSQ